MSYHDMSITFFLSSSARSHGHVHLKYGVSSLMPSHRISQFVGASQSLDSIHPSWCIVTEFLAGGDLKMYLRTLLVPPPALVILRMALDIASGMEYLHKLVRVEPHIGFFWVFFS